MIRVTRDDTTGAAIVSFSRSELRNALTPDMFAQLHRALDALLGVTAAHRPRSLILTGEGKVFCGGFDLKLCLSTPGTLAALLNALHATIDRLQSIDVPVVIAAQGAAIAGGCALLSAADMVITNAEAKLGYPVTPLGISPAISAPTLSAALGRGPARTRQLDPSVVSGIEAVRLGLAHECVETPGEVLPRAIAVAQQLSSKPPGAFAATKGLLRELRAADFGSDASTQALNASLSLAGSAEEHERLTALFSEPIRPRSASNSR
jgi:enoyl-CoA hydratase/carnithine racemase